MCQDGCAISSAQTVDRFSYLIDRDHRFLLIGIILLVMTAMFAVSGEAFQPRYGIVCRAEEPKRFFSNVVMWFLAGIFFICLHFFQGPQ